MVDIIVFLLMRKEIRLRTIKKLISGHAFSKYQPENLIPDPCDGKLYANYTTTTIPITTMTTMTMTETE